MSTRFDSKPCISEKSVLNNKYELDSGPKLLFLQFCSKMFNKWMGVKVSIQNIYASYWKGDGAGPAGARLKFPPT